MPDALRTFLCANARRFPPIQTPVSDRLHGHRGAGHEGAGRVRDSDRQDPAVPAGHPDDQDDPQDQAIAFPVSVNPSFLFDQKPF